MITHCRLVNQMTIYTKISKSKLIYYPTVTPQQRIQIAEWLINLNKNPTYFKKQKNRAMVVLAWQPFTGISSKWIFENLGSWQHPKWKSKEERVKDLLLK